MMQGPVLAPYWIMVVRDAIGLHNVLRSKRINISALVLVLIGSILLIYFGILGHIPEIVFNVSIAMCGLVTTALLYIWWLKYGRITLRCITDGTIRMYRVFTERFRKSRTVKVHDRSFFPQDEPIKRPLVPLERGETVIEVEYESQLDKSVVESYPQSKEDTCITWLAQDGIQASSFQEKERISFLTSVASKMQQFLDSTAPLIPGKISEPLRRV